MKREKKPIEIPSIEEIDNERKRIRRGAYYRRAFVGTISVLIVVAAIAVLIATLFLPILQISGDSMSPTLEHDEIVVLTKAGSIDRGDLIGFYYQGKILLKRVIALPGDVISIDAEGRVELNGELLDEPYVTEPSIGECDLDFPYTIRDDGYFVMGDKRTNSVDSRNSVIGTISEEDMIGRVVLRVWPLARLGFLS